MTKFFYYIIVYPFSLLPLGIIYLFTDIFYLLLITVIPYRKSVIDQNLTNSFPDKSRSEIRSLRRKFYRHFTDLFAEGIKNLSISEAELKRRFVIANPEIMSSLYDQRKNVLLVSGHYNNWEWLITCMGLCFKHDAYGIGMPLTSKFWDKKINERRSRYGMRVINASNYKEALASSDEPKAVLVLADQSPGDSKKSYWMNFLHQPTGVLFGPELIAHDLDYAVVFFLIKKEKRGHYKMELELLTDQSRTMHWGQITEAHVTRLENAINFQPEYWLWSHKRWKREVPKDLNQLAIEQHEKFNNRFGYTPGPDNRK